MDRSVGVVIGVVALLVLIVGCLCVCLIAGISLFTIRTQPGVIEYENPVFVPDLPVFEPTIEADSGEAVPTETLENLENTIVPIRDLAELAMRLEGKDNIPVTQAPSDAPFNVGDHRSFWVTDSDTNEKFTVTAVLRYQTEHVNFWIEDGVRYDEQALKKLVDTFEEEIYPTNREFFGSEWTPGVDEDPRLYILYARGIGRSVAGYYSSADQYHHLANQYSNSHEMFLLSADTVRLGEEFALAVLAHEFQHMIHWYTDRNEDLWLNEGFAELAAFLNGYDVGGSDYAYAMNPDMQLTSWANAIEDSSPHYGASFLFTLYFLDRFGDDATKALVAHEANGMVSVDQVLLENNITDSLTGEVIGADDVFADWVVASYLQDDSVGDGRYTYHRYPNAPQPRNTEEITTCPTGEQTADVSQYGVDYIQIRCKGDYVLRFEGQADVSLLPTDAYSGDYAFWSNMGDQSDMTLTQSFDFSQHSGPLTFSYWTWYDIEEDYDYLYLTASTDGGESWEILRTPSSTNANPTGNSYGWAFNGTSGGRQDPEWIEESVDISRFAGEEVLLRFEYVTDDGVNGEGFLLDDVSIPEIDYFSDFENDEGGWVGEGFLRVQNILPQTFRLALIYDDGDVTVQQITLAGGEVLEIPLQLSGNQGVTLAVSGTTRFTRQKAVYQYRISR